MTVSLLELRKAITPERAARIQELLAQRTRYCTVVLENIEQANNISAAMRSVEALGLQEISLIEPPSEYAVNLTITKGASEWIDIECYTDQGAPALVRCYESLRARGYRIIATTPHPRGYSLSDLPIDQPLALVFGTEVHGLSAYALDHADAYVTIPMYGFTKSFNISVSVAVCVYDVMRRVRAGNIQWQLTEPERTALEYRWLTRYLTR
jgi:tRNA (guanosine-2'-O-)-methyltransferase